MKFFKFAPVAFATVALAFSSCSKDNTPEEPVNPDDGGNGEMSVLTPQESKTFLSNTAKKLMDKFNPAEQREFIKFAAYFSEEYGDLDLPDNFYDVDYEEKEIGDLWSPEKFISELRRGVQTASPSMITRAAYEYTYNINFQQYAGEYVPGNRYWVKKKDSSDIVFTFTDENQNLCEFRVSPSGGTSDETLTFHYEDEGDWYNDPYSETVIYNLSIPRTMTITLKQNGNELANGHVKSKIDIKGHVLEADVRLSVANLEATATLNGSDSKITQNAELKVSGESVITEKAEVTGSNLCNLDVIMNAIEKEDSSKDDLLSFFSGGVANIDVMGDVQIYGKTDFNRDVLKALDNTYCSWGYSTSRSEAEDLINNSVRSLNNNVTVVLKYQNKATTQATLLFTKGQDSWGNSGEYFVEPVIKFADETTYSFDEYFSRGFASVADSWEELIDSYIRVWRNSLK